MAGTLTRSRIEAFDQTANQLSQYAARWRAAAGDLDQAAQAYVSQIASPSGTQWQGQASAAALDAAHLDRVSVVGAVMHAHDMADTAEKGSSGLLGAREGVLEAIAQAEADDFTVGEDPSVADNNYHADPASYAARMTQAEAHLGYIEHHAGLLEAENQRVAAQLGAGATQMGGMVPTTWRTNGGPKAPENPRDHKPKIQAVDRILKQGPDQPPWQPPPPPYPQGPPLHPGLPPDGVHPPVDGPVSAGSPSRPSAQRDGELSLWDKNGGEWRYDPGQDPRHYPHWDYNPHAQKFDQWRNVGINDLPTHREGVAPPRSGTVGTPPAAAQPAPPGLESPAPKVGEGTGIGGGPSFGPQVISPPHAHQHWLDETHIQEWGDGPAGSH